jgi:D-beta-D-heptose 7-phosphate kinase/D-beta-D-heptose 1-phosphate adenosyltransferase
MAPVFSSFPFNELNSQRILVIGDLLVDEYIIGECGRISPEAPVPVVQAKSSYRVLGGAANTAANVASMGGKVTLMGLIGADEAGTFFQTEVQKQGLEFIPFQDGRPTIKKSRVLGPQQQLLRIDYEETHSISKELSQSVHQAVEEQLPQVDIVVLSDYAKGFLAGDLCKNIIASANKLGIPTVVDPKVSHWDSYINCGYITPNWKEGLEILGKPYTHPDPTIAKNIAQELSEKLHCNVVLTMGPEGICFYPKESIQKEDAFILPTEAKEVFDVSGAGDTVVAWLSMGLASGLSHRDAIHWANVAAGIVVGKQGTSVLHPTDFDSHEQFAPLVEREQLAPLSKALNAQGKKVVTLNGSFDLLHSGHLHILREAKKQGDVLIVGLNSDSSVRGYKGPTRPIITEQERANMLLGLQDVDYVHIFSEADPIAFLVEIRPHVHVNGAEYGEDCIEADVVQEHGGKIHIVTLKEGLSTSSIVKKIQDNV